MVNRRKKGRWADTMLIVCCILVIGMQGILCIGGLADDTVAIPGTDDNDDADDTTETDGGVDVFDAHAFVASNYETKTNYRLHLYAFPGHTADIYRDFAIYIYVDKPANFIIKIDDQKVEEGAVEWRHIYRGHSEYNFMDVEIVVQEKEGERQRKFTFTQLDLLDSPWQADKKEDDDDDEEEKPAPIAQPYISMGQGEFTIFILVRVLADAISALFGALIAIKFAAIRSDLVGIQRMF